MTETGGRLPEPIESALRPFAPPGSQHPTRGQQTPRTEPYSPTRDANPPPCEQPALPWVDPRKIAHRHDPATSKDAAQAVTRTGRASRNVDRVVALVRAHPERTAAELAQYVTLELQEVRRRLTDAKRLGLVVMAPSRVCSVRGTKQHTWGVGGGA